MRLGFAASALLVLLSGSVSLWAFRFALRAAREAATKANDLIEFARFEAAAERKMSTFRGYLLTGDDGYLQQMQAARRDLLEILRHLDRRASSQERRRLLALLRDEASHQTAADEAIRLRGSGRAPEEVSNFFVTRVEPLREALETEMAGFLDQKREAASAVEVRSRQLIGFSVAAIVLIVILALVLTLSLFRFLGLEIGQHFELERAQRRLAEESARALAESEQREQAARTAAEAAERRSTFLAEASEELSSSLDFQTTLTSVARLAVPAVADWCFIDILRDGRPQRLAVTHRDPSETSLAEELRHRHLLDPNAPTGPPHVMRTGQPELLSDFTDATLKVMARSPEDEKLLRSLNIRSAMCVPLRAGARVIGVVTFVVTGTGRRFSTQDLKVADDLARRASLAIENARLYSESQEAIQAREEFLSVASHELKTPITTLQLQIQSIVRYATSSSEGPSGAKIVNRLAVAEQQTLRLSRLVENLLDISRIASGRLELKLERVDLNDVVRGAVTRFREQLVRANCPVEVKTSGDVVGTWDRMRLEQIVTNLLSNAAKYGAGRPLEITVLGDEDLASFAIRDRGIGIAPEHQARIFGRFERAVSERHYGGLGLGLWIVHQIVESLGGRIRVTSEPGKGSTFVVELPRTGRSAMQPAEAKS